MGQFSRLSSIQKYTYYEDENKFISDILNICSSKEIKVIIPSHNETEIIARHSGHKFSDSLVSMLPDESHCRMFNNKSDAYDYVSNIGIPVPCRINYTNPNLLSQLLENKGLVKTVIKLLTGNSGKGVFYGEN